MKRKIIFVAIFLVGINFLGCSSATNISNNNQKNVSKFDSKDYELVDYYYKRIYPPTLNKDFNNAFSEDWLSSPVLKMSLEFNDEKKIDSYWVEVYFESVSYDEEYNEVNQKYYKPYLEKLEKKIALSLNKTTKKYYIWKERSDEEFLRNLNVRIIVTDLDNSREELEELIEINKKDYPDIDVSNIEFQERHYSSLNFDNLDNNFKGVFNNNDFVSTNIYYFQVPNYYCVGQCLNGYGLSYYEITMNNFDFNITLKKLEEILKDKFPQGYDKNIKNGVVILKDKSELNKGYIPQSYLIWHDKKDGKLKMIQTDWLSDFDVLNEFINLYKKDTPFKETEINTKVPEQQIQQYQQIQQEVQ